MSYSISVRVIQQSDPSHRFSIVEKTNWHYARGGTWAECNGVHTLTMGGSGTSGMLRFKNHSGEYFLVALGVHNYKRWCDIVTDAKRTDKGAVVNSTYYDDKPGSRYGMLWKQLPHLEKTTGKGVKVKVDFCQGEGHCLQATITITNLSPTCPQPHHCHPHPKTCPQPQHPHCHPHPKTCPQPQQPHCHPHPKTCPQPQQPHCHPHPKTCPQPRTSCHPKPHCR